MGLQMLSHALGCDMALSTLSRWDSHPGTSLPQRLDFDPNMAIFWTIAAPDRYPETTPHVSRVFGCARLKLLTNVVKSPVCKLQMIGVGRNPH